MRTVFNNLDIQFARDNLRIHAIQLSSSRFLSAVPLHSHGNGCYEIHYIPSGFGRAQIEGSFYEIAPQTLYITGPHIEHAQIPLAENPMLEYCLYLRLEKGKNRYASPLSPILSAFEKTHFWFGKDSQGVETVFHSIFREMEEKKAGYTIQVETLLEQLIVHIARNYPEAPSSPWKPDSGFLPLNLADRNSILIEEAFLYQYRTITLERLADQLGLSQRQTERLLQEQYGQTFLEKKKQARMSAAAILCFDPARSISSIAEEVGYSSIEHFSSAFKRHYHMSAREYRKRLPPAGTVGISLSTSEAPLSK